MTAKAEREAHYRAQNGLRTALTPRQRRRVAHKLAHQLQHPDGSAEGSLGASAASGREAAGTRILTFKDIHGPVPIRLAPQKAAAGPERQPVWRGMSRRIRMRKGGHRNA